MCNQLWRRYYTATLEEFACEERVAAAARMNDPKGMFQKRLALESATTTAELVREDIAEHRKWHLNNKQAVSLPWAEPVGDLGQGTH